MVHGSSARTSPCSRACTAPMRTDMQQPRPRRGELSLASSAQMRTSPSGWQSREREPSISRALASSPAHAAARSRRARTRRGVCARGVLNVHVRCKRDAVCAGLGASAQGMRALSLLRRPDGNVRTSAAPARSRGELPAVPPSRKRHGVRAQCDSARVLRGVRRAASTAERGPAEGRNKVLHSASDVA